MSVDILTCEHCKGRLPQDWMVSGVPQECPTCQTVLSLYTFPAMLRGVPEGDLGEAIIEEEETNCFNHMHKRAEVACGTCGRFLCHTCDIEMQGAHYCPKCLEAAQYSEERFRTRYPRSDRIALLLAVVPIIFLVFPTLITAPIALVLAICFWRYEAKPIHYSRVIVVSAIVLSTIQIVAWGMGIVVFFSSLALQDF